MTPQEKNPEWPREVPNPTWHDHFYGQSHSALGDEEHHKAVDALLRFIQAAQQTITELSADYKAEQERGDTLERERQDIIDKMKDDADEAEKDYKLLAREMDRWKERALGAERMHLSAQEGSKDAI